MKSIFSKAIQVLLVLPVSVAVMAQASFAADYVVDKDHTSVTFAVSHLVSKTKGEFKDFEGTFNFDPSKVSDAKGSFVVKTASISTNHTKRDEHLRGADFFDVKKFPEMTLANVRITPASGKQKYKMLADLTLHGVTKPVTFALEFAGVAADPWGGKRAGFTATTQLNRKDYGMTWNKALDAGGLLVGEEVAVELQVEGLENSKK